MVKYRSLTDEELKELEPEFKQFLITNAVYDEEWVELNKSNPEKATALVDQFSDMVLEKSLESIQFVSHASKSSIKIFWYRKDDAVLVGLESTAAQIDFTDKNWMTVLPDYVESVKYLTQDKKVETDKRSAEVFSLLSAGATIVDEKVFKFIHQLGTSKK